VNEGAFSPAQCDEVIRGGVVWLATARGVEQGLAPEVGARPRSVKQDSNERHVIDHLRYSLIQTPSCNVEGQFDRHVMPVHTSLLIQSQ